MPTTDTSPRLTQPCNGYFQVWERPCGHSVRQTTEFDTTTRKRDRAYARQQDAAFAARIAAKPCTQCQESAR